DDAWTHRAARADGAVDGYLNWVWDRDHSDEHRGRDINEIDEMRTHAAVAQLAYAFAANAELESPNGVDYAERAGFWLTYLRDHFEAKWRERNRVPWPEFPFLQRPHLHETLEFARYHHYMHLLTGEEAYAEEAARLSRVSFENFRVAESDAGPALVTPRSVLSMGGRQDYLIPSIYFRHMVPTIVDLYFEGVAPWDDDEVMVQLTRSVSEFILDEQGNGFARDIGGGRERAGIPASGEDDWARISPGVYNLSPFPLFAAWDESGEVAETSLAVHLHVGQREWNVYTPTGLLLDAALKRVDVAHRDQRAHGAVPQHLARAARAVGGDGRATARQRLHQRSGKALEGRGQHEDGCARHEREGVLGEAGEVDAAREAELGHERL